MQGKSRRGLHALQLGVKRLACAQVLDDSTDQKTRDLVDDKCAEWQERGVKCECVRRTNRQGYKAGALKDVRPCSIHVSPEALCTAWHPALLPPGMRPRKMCAHAQVCIILSVHADRPAALECHGAWTCDGT